ncbi:MAG: hypothetical protein ACRC9L_07695 [Brevinema sp.]
MLRTCFLYYGLSPELSSSLLRLAVLCRVQNAENNAATYHFSLDQAGSFLQVPASMVHEVLHYAGLFGLVNNVVLSPLHTEFSINPHYERDLFFAHLRLQLRKASAMS